MGITNLAWRHLLFNKGHYNFSPQTNPYLHTRSGKETRTRSCRIIIIGDGCCWECMSTPQKRPCSMYAVNRRGRRRMYNFSHTSPPHISPQVTWPQSILCTGGHTHIYLLYCIYNTWLDWSREWVMSDYETTEFNIWGKKGTIFMCQSNVEYE